MKIITSLITTTVVKTVLLSIALSLFSSAQSLPPPRVETSDIRNFIGLWVNVDKNTQGIKKIIISKAGHPKIQVFGACVPKACDWGIQQAKAYSYFSTSATSMIATYKPGFAIKELSLKLSHENQGKQLIVTNYTKFIDGSGRRDYNSEAIFKQVITKPTPDKHTAIKQLHSSTTLTPAQIRAKRLAEWYKAHPDKNPNKKKVVITKHQAKPLKSINQRLPKHCGFDSLYYGKVKYHKGNKAYYLTVKDRFTQNYNENFELTDFASPKLLNRYVVLYGGQLVGGRVLPDFNGAISGQVIQVVHNNQIDFNKLKVWCAKKEANSN